MPRTAGRRFRRWLDEGVLVASEDPAVWRARAGLRRPGRRRARRARGLVASLRAEPYETGTVLPHERTHAGPKRSGCACCAPRARSSSRSSSSTTAPPPLVRPDRDAGPRGRGLAALAARGRPGVRGVLRGPAAARSPTATTATRPRSPSRPSTARRARLLAVLVSTSRSGPARSSRRTGSSPAGPSSRCRRSEPLRRRRRRARAARRRAARPRRGRRLRRDGGRGSSRARGRARRRARRPVRPRRHRVHARLRRRRVARVDRGDADVRVPPSAAARSRTSSRGRARGEALPQKTTYFFPKLVSGLLFLPLEVIRWLELCRACVADIRGVLADLPTRVEREPVLRAGEGGDDTTAIDAAAEAPSCGGSRRWPRALTLVSEELGERTFGAGGPPRVVVDPIDGSVNAKRGIPFFSLSIAVADGPTMGDVVFGYVYDFGSGEEWTAERGGGAFLDGEPLGGSRPKDPIEILALRGNDERGDRRLSSPRSAAGAASASDGLARALALPPRGRPGRRRLLAEARSLGRHRGRAAPRARAGSRDRALRRPAVRRGRPRPRQRSRVSRRRRSCAPRRRPLDVLELRRRAERNGVWPSHRPPGLATARSAYGLRWPHDPGPRRDPEGARAGHRPRAQAAGDRPRHGARRRRLGRRRRRRHDRAHRRRLPAPVELPGPGRDARRRGAGRHARRAPFRRDEPRGEGRARDAPPRRAGRARDPARSRDPRRRGRVGQGRRRQVDPDGEPRGRARRARRARRRARRGRLRLLDPAHARRRRSGRSSSTR